LDEKARKGRITAYVGYDCTAPSLHIGNLISAMMLHWLQQTGHRPITLMGGGTTRVGDPSGKDETRKLLTVDQIEANKNSIKGVFSRFLDYSASEHGAIMVDNSEWLTKLNYIDMLRDIGRHFSINRMLTMDSVKLRLEREQELSFIEFNYMILQSYDFVELSRMHDCCLQMGGSDQWGNIVNGVELGRRMGTQQLYALTTPLLTTASGAKMGKTARKTFEQGISADTLPTVSISSSDLVPGLGVLSAFVTAGLVASTGEARRLVQGAGLRVNDEPVSDPRALWTGNDLRDGSIKLSLGKKRHVLLKPE
jgi:tyrosyl-tRNA synthetase